MAITATPSPVYNSYGAFDVLFDALHKLGRCGCTTCPYAPLNGGVTAAGSHWIAVVLPGGKRAEYRGATYNDAAQTLLDNEVGLNTIADSGFDWDGIYPR